jgi:hypothetical protein
LSFTEEELSSEAPAEREAPAGPPE